MDQPEISIQTKPFIGFPGSQKTAITNIDPTALYSRTPFSQETMTRLHQVKVAIFGAGSGGGKLALDLGRAGVGNMILTDPDLLEIHNVSRHIADLKHVGQYKVDLVADKVLEHNPFVTIDVYPFNCLARNSPVKVEDLLSYVDLVIAATDKTSVQLEINRLTWKLGIPTVFGGCYESARGGEVFFTLPKEGTPCLNCLRGGIKPPEHQGPFDYSATTSLEDYQGEPGLNAAVDLITDIEAQIALGILLRDTDSDLGKLIHPKLNFLLIGGALAADYYRFRRPFQIFFQPLAGPRSGCDVCQIEEYSINAVENLDEPPQIAIY